MNMFIAKPAADVLTNGKTQDGGRSRKLKYEFSHIVTKLLLLNKLELLEVLRIQTPYI